MTLPSFTVTDPALVERLQQLADTEARLRMVDDQLLALGVTAQTKRQEVRAAYRQSNEARFKGLDYKGALIGAAVEHALTIPGLATFYLRPPTAATNRETDRFVGDPVDTSLPTDMRQRQPELANLGPVLGYEAQLLSFIIGVKLGENARQDLAKQPLPLRLRNLRQLPDQLLRRVAEECATMEAWLNIVLEIELGNF